MYRWWRPGATIGTSITDRPGAMGESWAPRPRERRRPGIHRGLSRLPRAVAAVVVVRVGEPGERLQVGQALAPLDPPRPLPADRGCEAEHQSRVEVLVRVAEHAAEHPVDLVGGDRAPRQPPHQVDVTDRVQREVHAAHAATALEQEAVERRTALVRLAA